MPVPTVSFASKESFFLRLVFSIFPVWSIVQSSIHAQVKPVVGVLPFAFSWMGPGGAARLLLV